MKYCGKCGAELTEDSVFCNKCGNVIEGTVNTAIETDGETKPESSRLLKLLIGFVVIFMPYIGFFVVLIKRPFKKKTNVISAIYCVAMSGLLFTFAFAPPKTDKTVNGGNDEVRTVAVNNEKENTAPKQEVQENFIKKGDTISNDTCEIYIKGVELSYDVMPRKKGSFYTHYEAKSGQVYIDISTNVKNIQKQNLSCDEIVSIKANYNDGYAYSAFPVVEDETTGFTYANITSIAPLETKGMRFLIECPQEVEKTDKPLYLTLILGKNTYKYIIR